MTALPVPWHEAERLLHAGGSAVYYSNGTALVTSGGVDFVVPQPEPCAGKHCAEHSQVVRYREVRGGCGNVLIPVTPADLDTWAEDNPHHDAMTAPSGPCRNEWPTYDETQEWTPEALNRLRDVLIDADPEMWNHDPHTDWPAETETALRGGLRGDARKRYAEGLAETGLGVRERLERARGEPA